MAINARFSGGSDNGTGGDTQSLSRSVPAIGGFGAGPLLYGDLIVLQAVGGNSGGGLNEPVVTDNINGATGWTKLSDSGATYGDFRASWWWRRCNGGEDAVTVDWGIAGTQRGFEMVCVRNPGLLTEAYLMADGGPAFNPPYLELGPQTPSSDHEMYVGGTAMGPNNYTFASIKSPPGTHDNNGVGGDGFNAGTSDGVAGIMHINDNVPANLASDSLTYQSQPVGPNTWDAWVGLRAGCVQSESIDLFGNWHYGGGAPDGVQVSVGFAAAAAGDQILVLAGGIDGDYNTSQPVITDDAGSTGWAVDSDAVYGTPTDDFRVTVYRKTAVGGETALTVAWAGSTNKVLTGAVVRGLPVGAAPYIIDAGLGPYVGGVANVFQAGVGTVTGDGQVYLGLTCIGRVGAGSPPATDYVNPPRSTAAVAEIQDPFGGLDGYAFAWGSTCENLATDRPEIRSVGPDRPFFVTYYGFGSSDVHASTDGGTFLGSATPTVVNLDIHGTSEGGLLLGAAAASVSGAVLGESDGGLFQGSALGDVEGGFVFGESDGGVVEGHPRGTVIEPFPPVPNTPAMTGQLDCGVYDVFVFTRGLDTIVGRIPFNQINWTRVLDDTSSAEVTVNGVSNVGPMQSCCQLLGAIQPWEHELGIYRNGLRVWSGPVVKVSFPSETVVIDCLDLSAWLQVRNLHDNHNFVAPNADLADNWVALVEDAMSVENTAGLFPHVQAVTGVQGERLYTQDMHVIAADAISELARTGLDWYCVDRRMVGGPVAVQPPAYPDAPPIPTLIDESFRDAPTVERDGNLMGNCWYVNGMGSGPGGNAIFGQYGPHFPATPDHVESPAAPDYSTIEGLFGRIERIVSETKILDQPSIDQNAATRYDLTKYPVDVISSGTLLPTAGIDIRQLIPGSIQNVHLTRACVAIGSPYRLKQLTVTAQSDGAEQVEGTWEPVGSTAAHEDLG